MTDRKDLHDETRLVHSGRHPEEHAGAVNPPVYHVSTVLFPSVAALDAAVRDRLEPKLYYGRYGTPTSFALEEAIAALEGGSKCVATSSGLAAICATLCAFLKAGDHLLMVDSVYAPTRKFCDGVLRNFGVETTYYDPSLGSAIKDLMRPNTRVVFVESPGSLTFEVQDVPAIAAAAHAGGALVVMDNTWGTPLFFKPFAHGVDVSVQAATKYVVGHADAMLGTVTVASEAHWQAVKNTVLAFGYSAGAQECYLGLRGLRTLSVRLERHQSNGLALAEWLAGRPEVARVLHPALPGDPGHALWKRDFLGACGLFGVELRPASAQAVASMLDGLELFGMGFSWGGYESLILPTGDSIHRTAIRWRAAGPMLRLHVGLENVEDLKTDLAAGFARLTA